MESSLLVEGNVGFLFNMKWLNCKTVDVNLIAFIVGLDFWPILCPHSPLSLLAFSWTLLTSRWLRYLEFGAICRLLRTLKRSKIVGFILVLVIFLKHSDKWSRNKLMPPCLVTESVSSSKMATILIAFASIDEVWNKHSSLNHPVHQRLSKWA